jgi:hypothetical protein
MSDELRIHGRKQSLTDLRELVLWNLSLGTEDSRGVYISVDGFHA